MTTARFPSGFLWGASTAPHQVEGNNVASDVWAMEQLPHSPLAERSGDACDSYHRWREDLDLVRDLGLNSYRFGVEWARIEPAPGHVSRAELAHYHRMVTGCLERGLTPVVTLHHFTSPAWFQAAGGWAAAGAVEHFRRYVHALLPILDGVEWICTINEPNMLACIAALLRAGRTDREAAAALPVPDPEVADALVRAHHAASEELAALAGARTGWTVACQNAQPADDAARDATTAWAEPREGRFLDAAADDAFIGVQAYTRTLVGADGRTIRHGERRTLTDWEFHPQALGEAVSAVHDRLQLPILVTENGVATADDAERVEYLDGALTGLAAVIRAGADVRGYLHWSLLDNYEWGSWKPTFGLVAVDRETFARAPKPSARHLGAIARRTAVTGPNGAAR